MVLYGLSLSVMLEQIRGEYTRFLQSWYDDDFSTAGADVYLKHAIASIEALGPAHEFFLRPKKSQFVQSLGVSSEATRSFTAPLECRHG